MPAQPMAEIFGFRIDDFSSEAERHRQNRLCPFNNKVPSCTKDKANDPLGVCSIFSSEDVAITCPIRFRQDWLIASDAAAFFFPTGTKWTSLTEVRLNDKTGKSAGNIDVVLVAYDEQGQVTDFGALEVQAVYISGNIRRPFAYYMQNPAEHSTFSWTGQRDYPRADYLSSSRKRLAPQLIYKGGILHAWGRKIAVAIDRGFFATLPELPRVPAEQADVAWLIYHLEFNNEAARYRLVLQQAVYTQFTPALQQITTTEAGPETDFLRVLQRRLDAQQLNPNVRSDTSSLLDMLGQDRAEE